MMIKRLSWLFILCFSVKALADAKATSDVNDDSKKDKIPAGLIHLSSDSSFSSHFFVVDKKERTLSLYEANSGVPKLHSQYPTDIGKNPGPKVKENDFKTPVGIYFLLKQIEPPEIPFDLYGSLAFTTDYPNIFDQRQAKTGSGIWLHAVPDSVPLTRGSRGCVVVRNNVIKELRKWIKVEQTPMLIYEEVEYLPLKEYQALKDKMLLAVENWRSAWESQNVDEYMKYYDSTFKNNQMDYNQWYQHKKKLKSVYSFIKVRLGDPIILRNQDQVVIRFTQNYESNLHSDFGEKTIHAKWDNNSFKIIREDWTAKKSNLLPQAATN